MAYVPVPVNNGIYYTGAFPQATLGVYAQWWDSCNWAVDIDDGGNMSIIWMICGSPLSGKNHCQGSDIYGNSRQISVRSFIKLWPNFANIAAEFSRQQKPEQVYTISEVVDILKSGLDEKAFQEEMTRFCIKAKVLAADGPVPTLTVNRFGKGYGIYLASFEKTIENTRMLLNLIRMAGGELENGLYLTDNAYTECAYYPGSGRLVVINNSDQPQTTNVLTKNGSVEVSLEAYATKMLAVEG